MSSPRLTGGYGGGGGGPMAVAPADAVDLLPRVSALGRFGWWRSGPQGRGWQSSKGDLLPRDEFPASAFGKLHPEDRERLSETLARVTATGRAATIDYRVECRTGGLAFVHARIALHSPRPAPEGQDNAMWIAVEQDVTDRRETEAALAATQSYVTDIKGFAGIGTAFVSRRGRRVWLCETAQRLLDKPSDLSVDECLKGMFVEDRAQVRRIWRKLAKGEAWTASFKAGGRSLEASGRRAGPGDGGQCVMLRAATSVDETAALLAGLAAEHGGHDLVNMLATVLGFARLMTLDNGGSPHSTRILRAAQRAERRLRHLRAVHRAFREAAGPVDVATTLGEAAAMLRAAGTTPALDLPADLPRVRIDSGFLRDLAVDICLGEAGASIHARAEDDEVVVALGSSQAKREAPFIAKALAIWRASVEARDGALVLRLPLA